MLEEAHALLPSDLEVRLALAEVYVDQGRADDARPLLRSITAGSHRGSLVAAAEELLTRIPSGTGDGAR